MDVWIAILAVCYTLFAIVGVTGNSIMMIATAKSKKLQSVCHYLISALCLADLLHLSSQIPNAISLYAQKEFPQYMCFYVIFLPVTGAVASSLICLALGFDRLTAVLLPSFYRRIIQSYPLYSFLAYCIVPFAYTSWIMTDAFLTKSEDLITICAVPLAMNPHAFGLFTYTTVGINLMICALYLTTWLMIRRSSMGKAFRAFFKSITLTVMLVVFGWFATMIVNSLSFIVIEDLYVRMLVQMYAGFFVNSSASANIFVYYTINAEYRAAIRSIFRKRADVNASSYSAALSHRQIGPSDVSKSAAMDIWIAILAVSFALISVVGVTGNTIMMIAVAKSKKLQSACHYLISALCLADLLHISSQIPDAISLFAQQQFPQYFCFYAVLLPVSGAVISSPICLALGVDRLIAVLFPSFYRRIIQSYPIYSFLAYSIAPIIYTLWIMTKAFLTRSDATISICALPLALSPEALSLFSYTTVGINLMICALYFTTWLLIRRSSMGKIYQAFFKSIALTVLLVVFGWFATMIVNSLSFLLIKDLYVRMLVQMYAGFFVNLSDCANIFVYYNINTEYRSAIKSLFSKQADNVSMPSLVSNKPLAASKVAPTGCDLHL